MRKPATRPARRERVSRFDVSRYLHSEADIAEYLAECTQDKDPAVMEVALAYAKAARARLRTKKKPGTSRAIGDSYFARSVMADSPPFL
jgi:DNA-binding phage protein